MQDKPNGALTERAEYCASMARLLAERVGNYESAFDVTRDSDGYGVARVGYEIGKMDSPTNIERMIVQLRSELLELGKMVNGQ